MSVCVLPKRQRKTKPIRKAALVQFSLLGASGFWVSGLSFDGQDVEGLELKQV